MDASSILKTNDHLTNYHIFKSGLSDDDIERIKILALSYPVILGNVSGTIEKSYRMSTIRWLTHNDSSSWLYDKMKTLMMNANNNAFKFVVTNVKESLQFSEYSAASEGHYDWHMDIGSGYGSTRKISMSVQLSDPSDYDGGDLELMIHRNIIKVPRTKGAVIFFPSFLTHRVTPVTRGTRYSLVTWFHGPPFA